LLKQAADQGNETAEELLSVLTASKDYLTGSLLEILKAPSPGNENPKQ
jgi:hypothetical protein